MFSGSECVLQFLEDDLSYTKLTFPKCEKLVLSTGGSVPLLENFRQRKSVSSVCIQ